MIKFKNNSENELAYQTELASGIDIASNEYDFVLKPLERKLVSTGVSIEQIDWNLEVQIRPRSGLAYKHGITVLNSPGTIDADYIDKEIKVLLVNVSNEEYTIKKGERIAQMVLCEVKRELLLIKYNSRDGGFGSTGTGGNDGKNNL